MYTHIVGQSMAEVQETHRIEIRGCETLDRVTVKVQEAEKMQTQRLRDD